MHAADVKAIVEEVDAPRAIDTEAQETAARLSALLRHVFLYDRGNMLSVLEESGLSMTQTKALLELAASARRGSHARSPTWPRPSASRCRR